MLVALCHAANNNTRAAEKRVEELSAELHIAKNEMQAMAFENQRLRNENAQLAANKPLESQPVKAATAADVRRIMAEQSRKDEEEQDGIR